MTEHELRNFLYIPYDELEELNLEAKEKVRTAVSQRKLREHYLDYLRKEKRIKAVTVCFSDIEGRFHMLDYDKKYLLRSEDNLTFDGSSIRGFSDVSQSDLRIGIDWGSFRWLPADIFGPGKVLVFCYVNDRDGTPYSSDIRGRLSTYCNDLRSERNLVANFGAECEGFLFEGLNAEQSYTDEIGFTFVSRGGYFHSLPGDTLKIFIDRFAEAQRALGFENEKDHPEVAPSQFELNYRHSEAVMAADQVQLYKLIARQVAAGMNCTASFLPKPVTGINGSGMHCNVSLSSADGTNLFHDKKGEGELSKLAWNFVDRVLHNANDICLLLNPSVNAFRRLDPEYEAPNQIRSSLVDRTSMIRIPIVGEHSARIEVRTVSPDTNPYLAFLALLKTGIDGPLAESNPAESRRTRTRFLPGNIHDAIRLFKASEFAGDAIGNENKEKIIERKLAAANRSPRELGTRVKRSEIVFHHEVTNQYLWAQF